MLFTQNTEAGIALENAMLLTPEQLEKANIPANNARIREWARDNHINISIGAANGSDFNCTIGIMQDERVSDSVYQANKKMLKHLGDELIGFINNMPDQVKEAADEAEMVDKLNLLVDGFKHAVKELCGEDTLIHVHIIKPVEITADEFKEMLMKNIIGL